MQIIKSFFKLIVFVLPVAAAAQTTYLTQGDKAYDIINRIEIKQGTNTDINYSTIKPYSRKTIVQEAEFFDSLNNTNQHSREILRFSEIDKYDIHNLLMDNSEWVTGSKESFKSDKPFFIKSFYTTKPNLLEVNNKDFFLALNPVIDFSQAAEKTNGNAVFLNTRGVTVRGLIDGKIGFSATMDDNQERGPQFVQDDINHRWDIKSEAAPHADSISLHAVPGVGFYKSFKGAGGTDYFDARGYFTFNAAKFIEFQFGYDKNFIGDGYRSLFLSDFSNSYPFLKITTKVWKFDYENLFMELTPQFGTNVNIGDTLLDKKYATMHHLSMNVSKWLNIGLFESVMYSRKNDFELQYLNPVIFLRYAEGNRGSEDNAFIGLDYKANVAHCLQFYGQVLLDEFNLTQVRKNTGWWANKFGFQFGGKYIDAFGVHNLDLQVETNRVRPFTYTHLDGVADYTNYNQPLAHPLGANFQEFIGIANYRPSRKWYINAKLIYYYQGLDSTGYNSGFNPFRNYNDRYNIDYGYKVGGGRKATCLNGIFHLSYEAKENLFLDGTVQYRTYKVATAPLMDNNTTMVSAGVRWNIGRREYDY